MRAKRAQWGSMGAGGEMAIQPIPAWPMAPRWNTVGAQEQRMCNLIAFPPLLLPINIQKVTEPLKMALCAKWERSMHYDKCMGGKPRNPTPSKTIHA